MKIIAISDTHSNHRSVKLPEGDMIIHAGDSTSKGSSNEVDNFLWWFSTLKFKYKIFIAGNHDFFFEDETEKSLSRIIPKGIIYLNDSGVVIEGINIWGSPITPEFYEMAFNRNKKNISKHWKLIPPNTDILITHGPAYGILDKNNVSRSLGCRSLKRVINIIQPKLHIFGHIHESYGQIHTGNTTSINACLTDVEEKIINQPIEFNYQ